MLQVLLVLVLAGCHTDRLLTDATHLLHGVTVSTQPAEGRNTLVLLRGVPGPGAAITGGQVFIRVGPSTTLYRQTRDQAMTRISLSELGADAAVQVWTTGVEERMLPPIYTARQIVVLPPVP